MKKFTAILLAVITLITAVSCGEASYKNDVPVATLQGTAEALLADTDTFATLDNDYMSYMMELDAALFSEGIVRQQASGRSADEYGIFKAVDAESVASLEAALKAYLAKRVENWNPAYDADQRPKIDNAEVKVFGEYAVFAILSDTDRPAVFSAIEKALK